MSAETEAQARERRDVLIAGEKVGAGQNVCHRLMEAEAQRYAPLVAALETIANEPVPGWDPEGLCLIARRVLATLKPKEGETLSETPDQARERRQVKALEITPDDHAPRTYHLVMCMEAEAQRYAPLVAAASAVVANEEDDSALRRALATLKPKDDKTP